MNRTDILNYLISRNNYKSYLEIGVRNKKDNFYHIDCEKKVSVDPDYNAKADFIMPSDEFFLKNSSLYDLIFIDGLHLCEQVTKDINNSLKFLNKNGIIVCHDCLPNSFNEQIREYDGISPWTGDVWKAIANFRIKNKNVSIEVVNTDYGCGIIRPGNQKLFDMPNNENLNYEFFVKNKNVLMNVISIHEFLERY